MGDRVLVGTTDTRADMAEDAVCTDEEITYFFDLIKHVFPDITITRESIVYSFAGVRPLPRDDAENPGFVSRDYRIERNEQVISGRKVPVLSLVGGKWTTFRALSEHMTNDVLAILGQNRKVSTAALPIGGGTDFPATGSDEEAWIDRHVSADLDRARVEGLLTRYGTRATQVMAYLAAGEDRLLHSTPELSLREIQFMVRHEQIGHLIDVLIRRTSLAFRGLVTTELLTELAQALAGPLGWDASREAQEIRHAQDVLQRFHAVPVETQIS
jgi:glycerol-3-phosphate dehydrogenase